MSVLLAGSMKTERESLGELQLLRDAKKELALPGAFRITTAPPRIAMPKYVRLEMKMASNVPFGMAVWGF